MKDSHSGRCDSFSASHMMISKYKGARSCSFVRIVLLRLFFVAVQHGCEPERPRERCFSPAPAFFTVPSFFLVSLSSFLFAVIFFSHSPAARGGEWKRVQQNLPLCVARRQCVKRYVILRRGDTFFLSFSPLHPAVACVSYARVAAPTACVHARGARYIPRFVSVKRARSWGLTIVV